jgi:hypothetical protein
MQNPTDTNQPKPETKPDVETTKKPTQAIDDHGKPSSGPTVVPNPQDQEHKEPEKKRA